MRPPGDEVAPLEGWAMESGGVWAESGGGEIEVHVTPDGLVTLWGTATWSHHASAECLIRALHETGHLDAYCERRKAWEARRRQTCKPCAGTGSVGRRYVCGECEGNGEV